MALRSSSRKRPEQRLKLGNSCARSRNNVYALIYGNAVLVETIDYVYVSQNPGKSVEQMLHLFYGL